MDESIETDPSIILYHKIDTWRPARFHIELIENRVELQDDNLNLFGLSEPKQLSFLNFPDHEPINLHNTYSYFTAELVLASKIKIQSRTVYDMCLMFAEVGGLYDFMMLSFAGLMGSISKRFLHAALIEKLFKRVKRGGKSQHGFDEGDIRSQQQQAKNQVFEHFSFPAAFILKYTCRIGKCCRTKREKRYHKALQRGN